MSVDVVLVGAQDRSPGGTEALAAAIASRYGVPVEALMARLAAGSFRVKSDTDLETANRYARDLERLGGLCELRDAATGRVLLDLVADAPAGLAAASGSFSQDLGALDEGKLSLATLDGRSGDTEPPPIGVETMASSYDLATPPAGMPALAEPVDAFAPPTHEAAEQELMLAVDPRIDSGVPQEAPVARTMAPEPQAMPAPGAPMPPDAMASSQPRGPSLGDRVAATAGSAKLALARRTKGAFAAGVAFALIVGFLASHLVAALQESGAYTSVRNDLRAQYSEATDPDSHAGLDSLRANAVDLIKSRQQRIAITSLVVWLLFAAGAAAVWFRVIPWERLEPPRPLGT